MSLQTIIILAVIQGLAELLPVSSSAHVIAAAKILKLDPTTPQFVLLLVMLHTGTMFAVIVYFWRAWMRTFFHSQDEFLRFFTKITIATAITGVLGYGMQKIIERFQDPGYTRFVSWSISDKDHLHSPPTGESKLANLVATEAPTQRLFKLGETLTLNVKRDNDPLPYEQIQIKPTSTLNDLLASFRHGFAIDSKALPSHSGVPHAGVGLIPDPNHSNAVQIVIVGNEGRENRFKLADGFVDQAEQVRIGFFDTSKGEVEKLFKHLDLMAASLAAAGVLIFFTGVAIYFMKSSRKGITTADAVWLGIVQAICPSLPRLLAVGAVRTISAGFKLSGTARRARRGIQLRDGGCIDPAADRLRELPALRAHEADHADPHQRQRFSAGRERDGLQLPGRLGRAETAIEAA